jgi:DNA-binding transcriptional regulator YiaG
MSKVTEPKKRHAYPPRYDAKRRGLARAGLPRGEVMAGFVHVTTPSAAQAQAALIAIRRHLGLARGHLAFALGVPLDTLRGWETGRRSPSCIARHAILLTAARFGVIKERTDPFDYLAAVLAAREALGRPDSIPIC